MAAKNLVSLKVHGRQEALANLRRIRESMKGTPIEQALYYAVEPVWHDARAAAPAGDIANAIDIVVTTEDDRIVARIGVIHRFKKAFHALWVEMGTRLRFRKIREQGTDRRGRRRLRAFINSAASTGRMPERPFLRPALDRHRATIAARFSERMTEIIARAVRR